MSDKRCGTCRFWDAEEFHLAKQDEDYRVCQAVKHVTGMSDDDDCGQAFVEDGSGYYAALRTRNDFACSLGEEKK